MSWLWIGSSFYWFGLDRPWQRCFGNFGDSAGAAVLSREEDLSKGILSTILHSEGLHAEELIVKAPSRWVTDIIAV
jgi:3-oxoacyl-[acyl-carrier-protein] synthase-3